MATQLINQHFDAPLSKQIQQEYNKLVALISLIDKTHRLNHDIEGAGGTVSIADSIAYQIGWGKLLISWYETGVQGKMPAMPGEGFTKWDYVGLAKHFYQKYHYDGYHKQE